MTSLRFLLVFALANTAIAGAVSVIIAGGTPAVVLGAPLALIALGGFAAVARIVLAAPSSPPPRPRKDHR